MKEILIVYFIGQFTFISIPCDYRGPGIYDNGVYNYGLISHSKKRQVHESYRAYSYRDTDSLHVYFYAKRNKLSKDSFYLRENYETASKFDYKSKFSYRAIILFENQGLTDSFLFLVNYLFIIKINCINLIQIL